MFSATFTRTAEVEYGPGCLNMMKKAYFSLFRINTFLVFSYSDDGSSTSEIVAGMVTVSDFSRLDKHRHGTDVPKELCCDRTHRVSSCCMIENGGSLAYIHWIYTNRDYSRFIRLDEDVAEINNVLTLPGFRGRNLAAKALRNTAMELKRKGYRSVVAAIHDQNIASIKAFVRAGFVEVGRVKSFGPFNKKITI